MVCSYLQAQKRIGCRDAPLQYAQEERVFSVADTPENKAVAKQQVIESLQSRILSNERENWNASSYYVEQSRQRLNLNGERNRTNVYQYNFRAEKLPRKWPTSKPKANRFNIGIIEAALKDEDIGEAFGDERVAKGFAKRIEEIPVHPDLVHKEPWHISTELPLAVNRQRLQNIKDQRGACSEKWSKKIQESYKTPLELARAEEERIRERKRQERAQASCLDPSSVSGSRI